MAPFPLAKLPILAAKMAFEQMEPSTLFILSGMSTRMQKKMAEAAVRCERHSVAFIKENPSIVLNFLGNRKLEINLNQSLPRDGQLHCGTFKKMNFIYYQNLLNSSKILVMCERKEVLSLLYKLYDHLAATFPTPIIGRLEIDTNAIKNVFRLLRIPEFAKCEVIHLTGDRMDHSDAEYLLDTCLIKETFVLKTDLGARMEHPRLADVKNIGIFNNSWVSLEDVVLMRAARNIGVYTRSSIKDTDIVEFVNTWKRGDFMPNLKCIEIEYEGIGIPDRERILCLIRANTNPEEKKILKSIFWRQDRRNRRLGRVVVGFGELRRPPRRDVPRGRRAVLQPTVRQDPMPEMDAADILEIERYEEETLAWRIRRDGGPGRPDDVEIPILDRIKTRRVNLRKHGARFVRENEQFCSMIRQPNTVTMTKYDFEVVRADGIRASIRILDNLFSMFIWHKPPSRQDPMDI
ncbi:unnamed protein product [Caenorhabditis sp. 36 PRJEB53466]|nr:unnamed protein product [Caenorhabditis sp. 36 PRJEB53466]